MAGSRRVRLRNPILLFDGQCLLCARAVQFLLRIDVHRTLRFAPLQGRTAQTLRRRGVPVPESLEAVVLVTPRAAVYQGSTALCRTARYLRWPWRATALLELVPVAVREPLYQWVAVHRYSWFGRSNQCSLPGADRERLLP